MSEVTAQENATSKVPKMEKGKKTKLNVGQFTPTCPFHLEAGSTAELLGEEACVSEGLNLVTKHACRLVLTHARTRPHTLTRSHYSWLLSSGDSNESVCEIFKRG